MSAPKSFAFVDDPLDRSDALRDDAAKLAAWWPYSRVILLDDDGQALADAQGELLEVSGLQFAMRESDLLAQATFLGIEHGATPDMRRAWFSLPASVSDIEAPRRVDLRTAAAQWSAWQSTLFAQARAMLHWRARHRYCGACGGALAFERGGWQARCTQCRAEHYPRTDPAIIVAVTDGERLLLGRQASWPSGRYSTLAGFVEPGETLEQTVAREVLEESGVRVVHAHYLASQPWPFPGSLMLGFVAHAEPDTPRVGDELEDARWFTHAQIDAALRGEGDLALSPSVSISRWLIEHWHANPPYAGVRLSR